MFQKISWNCFIWYQEFFSLDFLKIFWLAVFHRNVSISRVFFFKFQARKIIQSNRRNILSKRQRRRFSWQCVEEKIFQRCPRGQKTFQTSRTEDFYMFGRRIIWKWWGRHNFFIILQLIFWNLKRQGELSFFFTGSF